MHGLRVNFAIISYRTWDCRHNYNGGRSTLCPFQSCVFKLGIHRTITWQSEKDMSSPLQNPDKSSPRTISNDYHIRGVESICTASHLQRDHHKLALGHIEQSLQHLQLEAIYYAPTMYAIKVEVTRKSDRGRMVNFLRKFRRKWFPIIEQILSVLEEA